MQRERFPCVSLATGKSGKARGSGSRFNGGGRDRLGERYTRVYMPSCEAFGTGGCHDPAARPSLAPTRRNMLALEVRHLLWPFSATRVYSPVSPALPLPATAVCTLEAHTWAGPGMRHARV
ncbi:hypothetical protein ACLOJK_013842 [Asimina triloba]